MKKFFAFLVVLVAATNLSYGQAISQNGGSIQGSITDPSGAVVPGATITIASPDTGYTHTLTSDKSGYYSLGPLIPGTYSITITAPNFETLKSTSVVRVGTVTSGNEKLTLGKSSETIEVNAGEIQINTEQIGVAGVITKEQIDSLPINGRNALDVAQIQPGVVLQSGQTFDPTKSGYSALAVNGVNGRTTRVLVDGQDISDETVGTVVYNVPEGAIDELQLNRSTQDVSGSVTSTGQVLMSTRSGTNTFHGNLFYNFQDYREGFANVGGKPAPFQRNQYGGYVGGYIIKDKLFFFGGSERIKQDDSTPVGTSAHFNQIFTAFPNVKDPFRDTFSMARLDYNGPWGVHFFARATYSVNAAYGTAGIGTYSVYKNQDNVPALVGGADFTTGKFTHSVRFGYLKFINDIADGTVSLGNSIYNPTAQAGFNLSILGLAGPNYLAPQATYQSSKDLRYDGSWTRGAHNIKFGGEMSRILGGGFAPFFGKTLFAEESTSSSFLLATCGTTTPSGGFDAGATTCSHDPLYGYSPYEFILGNGNGVFSERPGFGLPGGGQFSWRIAAYVADSWKVTPSLTVQAGLRWSVDTDRGNQDVPTPTCGSVSTGLQFTGCNSSNPSSPLFSQYDPGGAYHLGQNTHQPYGNFGPQAGFVFSPGSHKLAIRGGGGIYYESNLFNNTGNARSPVITATGKYFNDGGASYASSRISLPGYGVVSALTTTGTPCTTPGVGSCNSISTIMGQPLIVAATAFNGLKTIYDAASNVNAPNPSYIGTGGNLAAENIYGGPYLSPYAIQLNGGGQYQISHGLLLSVDFIHSAILKIPATIDTNHTGAARTLNTAAAQAAIAGTTSGFGCAGGYTATAINCAIAAGATINDFAGNGLDSLDNYLGGVPASVYGLTASTGAAFPGYNTNVGDGNFILPVAKAGYDALQVVVQEQKAHPLPYITQSNFQISYNFSRAVSSSGGGSNQFFAGAKPFDQDCVNCNMGRNDLDQSNQLSLGGSFGVKYGLQVGLVGHFSSATASTLTTANLTSSPGIFTTDFDGDGQGNDLLLGTLPGYYGHQVRPSNLNAVITRYNNTVANQPTPAGKALIAAGLFNTAQLQAIGAVAPAIGLAPANALVNAPFRTLDASVSWPFKLSRFREGLSIVPGMAMYNVTNMSNFGGYGGDLSGDTASLNGPGGASARKNAIETTRTLRGSGNGTFDAGGPRTTEFQLKLNF
jgi:hypothetical protein